MRALAFDLSSRTGWAAWDGVSPLPTLGKKRVLHFDRGEGEMLEHWRLWLGSMLAEHRPDVIACEAPAMGAHSDQPTIYRQAMLLGMVAWAAHVSGIPRHAIGPATWRKSFIGFGTRGKRVGVDWKALALQRARALGADPPDHNSAEAFGVLDNLITVQLKLDAPWRAEERADSWLPLPELGPQCLKTPPIRM